jgi:hypothetical protein
MNLNQLLFNKKINSLGFDTIYLEKPVSYLIDFNWKNILQPPPSNSDNDTIKELELISKETKNRTQQDIELIYNIDLNLDDPFLNLMKIYNLNYPQKYIDIFYDIVRPVLLNTKNYWNRPRPTQLAKLYNINIDIIKTDTTHSGSYPSGHTVYSKLVANILKSIYPQIDSKSLTNIVYTVAQARVMQGVHYPSDNRASLIFADVMFAKLNKILERYYNDTIQ